eukprot:s733_g9.t1
MTTTAAIETPVPGEDAPQVTPQLPWNSIPKFVPGTTNVQEYVQKMKFLAAMWPSEHLSQLAPRAALLVEGTAFKKVARLDPSKLRVNDQSGVALLVDAIGGSWGATELEERYEYFERALYGTVQRADESHDSYLSRMEASFIELLSRGTKLEEVQAYVLLRQSLLSSEDKKRILLEHSGKLEYNPVVKSFRLLGSKFFSEVQGSRQAAKTKVYDVNLSETAEGDFRHEDMTAERAFVTMTEELDPELDGDFMEAMIAAEDHDALVVNSFEQELEEFLQDVPDMHQAMLTYLEARSKLQEKRRSRGFWPVRSEKGGKATGKFKGRGKGRKQREQLLSRIARSTCRLCNQKGHWKAECPNRDKIPDGGTSAVANIAEEVPALDVHEVLSEPESVPSVADDDTGNLSSHVMHGDVSVGDIFVVQALHDPTLKHALQQRIHRFFSRNGSDPCVKPFQYAKLSKTPRYVNAVSQRHVDFGKTHHRDSASEITHEPLPDVCNLASVGDKPGHAILDTGASRCVIGEKIWLKLFSELPVALQQKVRKSTSQVKFRFGNNQTLQSEYKVQLPLHSHSGDKKRLLLTIEVLPGSTPFLFSKRAFKQLGGILNTTTDTCFLQRLDRTLQLELNPTELYLLDVIQLCAPPSTSFFKSFQSANHAGGVQFRGSNCSHGSHDSHMDTFHENQIESIALTLSKPATSSPDSPETFSPSPELKHAACPNDELLANCGRGRSESSDHVVAVHDPPAGVDARKSREPRESSGNDEYSGRDGDRIAKSTDYAAEPYAPRKPATGGPKFNWRFNQSRRLSQTSSSKISTNETNARCESGADCCNASDLAKGVPGSATTERSGHVRCGLSGIQPCDQLAGFGGERRGGDCGPRGEANRSESFADCCSIQFSSSSKSCGANDHGGLGTDPNYLGKETQRQDVFPSLSLRSRLFPVGKCPVQQPDARDAGFCPVLSGAGGSRTSHLGSMKTPKIVSKAFHAEVSQVRNQLKQHDGPNLVNTAVCDSFQVAEKILQEAFVSPAWSMPQKPCILLEVYAGQHSPMTEAMRKLGYFAVRFTRQDGDLATPEGRKALWNMIDKYQPLNIWVAPECGPWGGWNRLNMFKSVALFDKVMAWQKREACHVELCSQLCEFQVKRSRHFHLEQPNGSTMPQLNEFLPIRKQTDRASFDMCMFGLKHPVSKKFLRKSSQVFTTDLQMVSKLQVAKCDHLHEYQAIEGSVSVNGCRMPLTQFCASYCSGFVQKITRWMIQHVDETAFVGDTDDEPPAKRSRFTFNPLKRFKASQAIDLDPSIIASESDSSRPHNVKKFPDTSIPMSSQELPDVPMPPIPSVEPPVEPSVPDVIPPQRNVHDRHREASIQSPVQEQWKAIFQALESTAPRVGNLRLDMSHAVVPQIQALVSNMIPQVVYVCRGTERMQVPLTLPDRNINIMRHTVCLHRITGEVHDFGSEEWINLKRSDRIRNAVPSKLMITSFGTRVSENQVDPPQGAPMPGPVAARVSSQNDGAPCPDNPGLSVAAGVIKSDPPELCEGWAPPPTAIHGPKFRDLTTQEKSDLRKLHLNLGHPDPNVLAEHLKAQQAAPHVVEAAREFVCDACVESVGQKHQRPAKLHDPKDFNDLVGIDGFYWSGSKGFSVHVFHCIDEASLFHLGRRCETRNADQVVNSWSNFWTAWAGDPNQVYTDPAGEFISDQWKALMRSKSIQPLITTEAWQRGRVERHGQIIKRMLTRCDLERSIESLQDFDQVLQACFQAKNSLMRQKGYSPEQIVLGKSRKLPASLTSDESAVSHELALEDSPESDSFRRLLDIRTTAKKAFLMTDNDQAIRRALLRRSCPVRGPFLPGQLVMYWVKRRSNRQEAGRWYGPAKVILQESQSAVWLSHAERLFKCAPESIRPASLREWNTVNSQEHSWIPQIRPLTSTQTQSRPPDQETDYEPSFAPVTPPLHESIEPSNTGEQIDLDAGEAIEDSGVPDALPVLHCHTLVQDPNDETLYEVSMLQPGETTESPDEQVLFAEDGMPIIDDPLECREEQCFALSIDINENDIHKWSASEKPEELAWIASVCKRARAEVSVKTLSLEEKILFEKAKDAELNCWMQTSALKPILRQKLNPEQILRSRWILTWKPINEEDKSKPQRKAKARLVVLGYLDPKLTEVARDSPTLTREGRNTVLQTISSRNWVLSSFDIQTAFLRGQADKNNPLAMEPPPELRRKLNLSPDEVCSLVGNAYGRVDAPLLFYKEFSNQLSKLNFTRHPLEPCVFQLETFQGNQRTLHGIIGTHVDDSICGGDQFFHEQLDKLKKVLPFGSFKQRKFVFTGIQLEQLPDFSIMASQEDYVRSIPAIDVGRSRRLTPDSAVSEAELNKLRGLIGSLQYAVSHTRPDIAAKLGEVQVQVSKATVQTLLLANKVLREAQENSHVKICFRSIPVDQVSHVSFGDASFASAKQLSSFQGTLICATNHELNQNKTAPLSPLTWTSKKIARVVRSTLSAEAFAMSNSVDRLAWMRLLWGTVNIPNFNWREPLVGFKSMPKATIVTDCKSLYDLVSRTAMPTCEEFRTTLEVLLIRERSNEHCQFRWIPTALQVADALTKPMDPILLRQVLASGCFQLHDEDTSLERNAHRKQAVKWFQDQQNNSKAVTSTEF